MNNNKLIAYMEKIGIMADKPGKYTPGAKNDIEWLIHQYHESGRYETDHGQLVKEIKSIMSDYETAYNERVNADKIVKFPA